MTPPRVGPPDRGYAAQSGVSLAAVTADARAAHMVRLISQMTRTAPAQMIARQTINIMPRRRWNLSIGASTAALTPASSATAASSTTTDVVERKSALGIGGTIPEAIRLSAWNRYSPKFLQKLFVSSPNGGCDGVPKFGRVHADTGEQRPGTAPHRWWAPSGVAGSQWCNRLPARTKGGSV